MSTTYPIGIWLLTQPCLGWRISQVEQAWSSFSLSSTSPQSALYWATALFQHDHDFGLSQSSPYVCFMYITRPCLDLYIHYVYYLVQAEPELIWVSPKRSAPSWIKISDKSGPMGLRLKLWDLAGRSSQTWATIFILNWDLAQLSRVPCYSADSALTDPEFFFPWATESAE